jgi:hypothetical protein
MSFILYYSNHCNHSKNILSELTKSKITDSIHFICIDNRVKEDSKVYIILQNNKKILLPDIINRVPALMSLKDYQVYFGEDINKNLKPQQDEITRVSTENNLEPMAYSFMNSNNSNIVSDTYCFLDTPFEEMTATGSGGLRQLHQYFKYDQMDTITNNVSSGDNGNEGKNNKLSSSITIEQLQRQRENELK